MILLEHPVIMMVHTECIPEGLEQNPCMVGVGFEATKKKFRAVVE